MLTYKVTSVASTVASQDFGAISDAVAAPSLEAHWLRAGERRTFFGQLAKSRGYGDGIHKVSLAALSEGAQTLLSLNAIRISLDTTTWGQELVIPSWPSDFYVQVTNDALLFDNPDLSQTNYFELILSAYTGAVATQAGGFSTSALSSTGFSFADSRRIKVLDALVIETYFLQQAEQDYYAQFIDFL